MRDGRLWRSAGRGELRGCPERQLLATDLGVVADVHRESRMEQHGFDGARVRIACGKQADLCVDAFARGFLARLDFDA